MNLNYVGVIGLGLALASCETYNPPQPTPYNLMSMGDFMTVDQNHADCSDGVMVQFNPSELDQMVALCFDRSQRERALASFPGRDMIRGTRAIRADTIKPLDNGGNTLLPLYDARLVIVTGNDDGNYH